MLIYNIGSLRMIVPQDCDRLRGEELGSLPGYMDNAWLRTDGDKIAGFGSMTEIDLATDRDPEKIDARGGLVLPAFCDSHTHIVYPQSRHGEYLDKLRGATYEEIARNGGGILNTARAMAGASEEDLYRSALERLNEIISKGTATVEIKTGYGLTTESELKMLRVIARLKESSAASVHANFLGAHAVGPEFRGDRSAYVDYLITDMLPAIAAEGVAEYIDVFCDEGFFTAAETDRILEAGARYGLRSKIHANELSDSSGGVGCGLRADALSVDHLERINQADIPALALSSTVATMLPGTSFFLNIPYAPARELIRGGCTVALASDYNPGSSPSGDMRFVMTLACTNMRLMPDEALAAATLNGAAAMGLGHDRGGIAAGRRADLIISRPMASTALITYAYTTPWIDRLIIGGRPV